MEHPNSKCRIAQAQSLSRLPEEDREKKARDIRIGNASYIYPQQAVPIQENRLIMYYKEWLEDLPPNKMCIRDRHSIEHNTIRIELPPCRLGAKYQHTSVWPLC